MNETNIDRAVALVAAYVSNNPCSTDSFQALIGSTFASLGSLGAPVVPVVEKPVPAVSIKKSVTPDYLISLEDGKQYKSLKRHLAGRGLTPALYREKWGLPLEYPMVAANYAKQRSELAKSMGLGRKPEPEPVKAKAKRSAPKPASEPKPDPAEAAPVDE